jgi:hypothetical protein
VADKSYLKEHYGLECEKLGFDNVEQYTSKNNSTMTNESFPKPRPTLSEESAATSGTTNVQVGVSAHDITVRTR